MKDKRPVKTEPETIVLRPSSGWIALKLGDLWHYRELVYFMTWRDLKVRYKQTLLGVTWAIIQPFLTMVVFSIFFGGLAKIPSDGIPYPIFAYTALLPWTLFANALNNASRSLVSHQNMVTKIYFPRLVLPLASVMAGVVDFALAFIVLIGMMIYYQASGTMDIVISSRLWTLIPFILLALVTALGVALWLSALYVKYRDVHYILPFLSEVWKYMSPIAYSTTLIPEKWQILYSLNPMAGVVNGFRWALLGTPTAPDIRLVASVGVSLFLLVSGLFYFRRMEKTFADTI